MIDTPPSFAAGRYKALVVGSSGAIGGAFAQAFFSDPQCTHVELVSRGSQSNFDLTNHESISAQATLSSAKGPYEIIIDATGAIAINGVGPEKALHNVRPDQLMQSFWSMRLVQPWYCATFRPYWQRARRYTQSCLRASVASPTMERVDGTATEAQRLH